MKNKTPHKISNMLLGILMATVMLSILTACQKPNEKKYIVGIINPSAGLTSVVSGFKEGMDEQGYKEGENITYIYDGPLEGMEVVDDKIVEMLKTNVDLIYSVTTPATKKLKKALEGQDIPGVFGPVFDPVSSGIVESLGSPGGRLTGVKVRGSTAKALEWLLAIIPDVKSIFIPFHITDKAACQTVEDLEATASKFDINLVTEELSTTLELEQALTKIPDDTDAVWLTCSHLLMSNVDIIVKAALDRDLPTASSTHSQSRSEILVSYGESNLSLGRQVSRLADKILRGATPEHLPIETAEYILGVNLNTASTLGIEVPDVVLMQADYIMR